MISKSNVKFTGDVAWMVESLLQNNAFVFIFLKARDNKTIISSFFVISGIIIKITISSIVFGLKSYVLQ